MNSTDAEGASGQRQTVLQIGKLRLTGLWAVLGMLLLLLLIVALVIAIKPTLRMSLAAAIWLAFIVYWSAAAPKGSAPLRRSESKQSRAVHVWLLWGALLLLFLPVPGLRGRYLPLITGIVAAGLATEIASALFAAVARKHLGRNWSGAVAVNVEHRLVETGPYRWVRHPIYTGMLGMYAGTALVSGELHALIALLLILFAYYRKIRLEERILREEIGSTYDEYRRRTWALVPWVI
jgi:protein-S-isoprenylcysteine O-methyltransferase Ste14